MKSSPIDSSCSTESFATSLALAATMSLIAFARASPKAFFWAPLSSLLSPTFSACDWVRCGAIAARSSSLMSSISATLSLVMACFMLCSIASRSVSLCASGAVSAAGPVWRVRSSVSRAVSAVVRVGFVESVTSSCLSRSLTSSALVLVPVSIVRRLRAAVSRVSIACLVALLVACILPSVDPLCCLSR